jgi:protein-tyrosine phosphatase
VGALGARAADSRVAQTAVVIDLHCHILPGLDDGAVDLEDSAAMAAQALEDGIHTICATPHVRHDHDVRLDELPARVAGLAQALQRRGVGVRVVSGGEVAETVAAHLSDFELLAASLGAAGGWILLEPAPGPLGDSLTVAVDGLDARGFRSLIAHPERHLGPDLVPRLAALIERGALVQVTAATLTDPASAEGMGELAARGVVHVLGSDAHSSRHGRPVHLSDALARLERIARLRPHMDWIARTAPGAILRGEAIQAPFAPD